MNIDQMIDLLNEDLSREYSHWHFYINAAASVEGLHREEISEFLLNEAKGEMEHVFEFKKLLHGLISKRKLNKKVSTSVAHFSDDLKCPKEILIEALKMEDEVVKNYSARIEDACALQENGGEDRVDGKFIEIFLEDQLADSRKDADEIRMMVK
jgi:ferritin